MIRNLNLFRDFLHIRTSNYYFLIFIDIYCISTPNYQLISLINSFLLHNGVSLYCNPNKPILFNLFTFSNLSLTASWSRKFFSSSYFSKLLSWTNYFLSSCKFLIYYKHYHHTYKECTCIFNNSTSAFNFMFLFLISFSMKKYIHTSYYSSFFYAYSRPVISIL